MSVFQELYDSEINFTIIGFYDGGFRVKLGDELNGFDEVHDVQSWAEVEARLAAAAVRLYPEFDFAKQHGRRLAWI